MGGILKTIAVAAIMLLAGMYPAAAQQETPLYANTIKTKLLARYSEKRNQFIARKLSRIEAGLVAKIEAAEAQLTELIQKADSVKGRHATPPALQMPAPDTASLPMADFAEMDRAVTASRFISMAQAQTAGGAGPARLNAATAGLKAQLARITAIGRFTTGIDSKIQYYREAAQTITGAGPLLQKLETYKQLLYVKMEALKAKALQLSKAELALFDKIAGLQGFALFRRMNSGIAALFPFSNNGAGPMQPGQLQTTASVSQLLPAGIVTFNSASGLGTRPAGGPLRSAIMQARQQMTQQTGQLQGGGQSATAGSPAAANAHRGRKPFSIQFDAQFNRPRGLFPVTAQLGVRGGYHFRNTPLQAGFGIAYNAGLGTSFRNIALSNEGVTLRSFFEWRQKRGLLMYGGYELSHMARFASLPGLKQSDQWRAHALAGITKQYALGKKWRGSILLAYDFLHNTRLPASPPVIIRTGFGF